MVSVIIVNWNTGSLLARCLMSLRDLPHPGERDLISRVFVVDNASDDDSLKRAKAADAQGLPVTFIELKKNAGFARANNLAWRSVDRKDHVFLLNPDTVVEPGTLIALTTKLESASSIGVVGPRLKNRDGSWQMSVRRLPTLMVLVWMFLKLNRLWPRAAWWREYVQIDFKDEEQEVEQVMGAAFLIKNSTWQRVGMFDEGFYLWFEEVDYCRRVRAIREEIWYVPAAQVVHYGGASFDQLVGWRKARPFLKSSLYYARKHLGFLSWLVLGLLLPLNVILVGPAVLFHLWRRKQNRIRVS